jgi:branched-chain amino acid aminotransferase
MPSTATTEEYLQALLHRNRPGLHKVLAFYEHRIGLIGTDPRLMYIPLDDHLVHRGDGVFETLKLTGGGLYQVEPHLERMQRSVGAVWLQPPCSWNRVRELILEVARAANTDEGLLTLFIGRGPGGFDVDMRECPEPSLYIVVRQPAQLPEEFWERGATAGRVTIPAKQSYLSGIKCVDYLPNVLMKREATLKGYDFPLCFDERGFLAEGATENVCLVDAAGELAVPEFRHALQGTTLLRALELIRPEIVVRERPVSEEEILEAREVIMLGTTFDAVGVVRYDGRPIHDVRPGPVARRMRELIREDQQRNGTPVRD